MKSSDMWMADQDVVESVQRLIANFHPHLALVDKNIAIVMKAKASKSGGQISLGKASRAPVLVNVLGKDEYEFVLTIAADEWTGLSAPQKEAFLDHLLCACRVEEDEETHEIKCSIASPDVSFFYDELKRHGDWRPRPQEESGTGFDVEGSLLGGASTPDTAN